MNLEGYPYPFSYHKGKVTAFTKSDQYEVSYFGGPGDFEVTGLKHGPRPLHHIATIATRDLGVEKTGLGFSIPFYYGMRFDGGSVNYKNSAYSEIEVTAMSPSESSDDWPCPGFPDLLPYIPLKVGACEEMDVEEFSEYVMQGVDPTNEDVLILVVPPNPRMGVSMWGPAGDAEEVQIIFNCDVAKGTVEAYNACT